MKEILTYIKTTETCQLSCSHCFTSGSKGAKIFFNVEKTANWFLKLYDFFPQATTIHGEFHGGEPFFGIGATENMMKLQDLVKPNVWKHMSWGCTTNLVFKLTPEKLFFIKTYLGNRIGTSWDPNIRFATESQRKLWEDNVKLLISLGCQIKLFVSLTKDTIEMEPIKLFEYFHSLGVKEVELERLTGNGNATLKENAHIFPLNSDVDKWFLKAWKQTIEFEVWKWFDNGFFNNILTKLITGVGCGTFCRDCEQKLFTINADGTIAGCPNSAPTDHYGHIDQPIHELIFSPKRTRIIACERVRNPGCYTCPVADICGGDCHQLSWQDEICPGAKSLISHLKWGLVTKKYSLESFNEIVNYKYN